MTARISVLVLSLLLVSCGQAGPTLDSGGQAPPTAEPGVETTATLRVFQEQGSCCYMEGQLSYLSINGAEHEFSPIRIGLIPLIELAVPPEPIEVESWQRPCSGNCDSLDAPTNQCSIAVDAAAGETVRLLVSFEPGDDPCELTMLTEDPATSVPLGFGFRSPLPSCGEDYTMQMAMFGDEGLESRERQCFVDAYRAGSPAELASYEPPDPNAETDDILDLIIYRTQPDQPIEVFVNVGPEFEEWLSYRCDVLNEIESPALFELEECSEAEQLE